MAAIKCIIRQDWETRNASGELLDRHNRVYVTNEDGTPHVYSSIREARAEIVSNYGRDANRAGILHNYSVDDYSGNIHSGWIYIVREGSEEYAEATESAEAEQEATEQNAAELAEIIAEQARDYHRDTIYSAITAEDVEQADAYTNDHLPLTVEVMNALGIFHASNRMLVAIAQAMRWTLDDIEAQAIADRAREEDPAPAPIYQRHELEAFLGEPDDYDMDAIEAEATEYDPKTGRTVWAAFGDDLAAIAERHELYSYAPAI